MERKTDAAPYEIAKKFCVAGKITEIITYGGGHINATYLVTTSQKRYILQRINTYVFPDVDGLMRNVCGVASYLRGRVIETLCFVPTRAGEPYLKGRECWRMYEYIENAVAYRKSESCEIFQEAGRAFGAFMKHLNDYDVSTLTEVIPDFHNTEKRFSDFQKALSADVCGRARNCISETEFLLARSDTYSLITEGLRTDEIPLRVTHNDTKLSNILIDADTGKTRAVIDFDTVMPGSMLYDFGEAIRFGASTALEDERDLSKVHFSMEMFRAYATGFCQEIKECVVRRETHLFAYSAYLMTAETALRFLTDYLSGDMYYATDYPEHNLVRTRTQIRLASEMEGQEKQMQEIIEEILS